MEFLHSANSVTDFKISITTVSSRAQTFSVLSAPEDTILSREPNSQNQVSMPHRRSRGHSPNYGLSCPSTIFTWKRTSYSLGIRTCHPREFPDPFQKPEGETPPGSFPRPSCGPSEDSFTRPANGPQGDLCPQPGDEFVLSRGQVVRVFTKADPNFWLAIRDGSAVLAYANPSDEFQQWVMDERYSIVKDEADRPSFSLINKATGQALKHGLGETQPVRNLFVFPVASEVRTKCKF